MQGRRLKEVKKIAHLQSLGLVDEVLGSAAVLAPPHVEVTPAKGKGQPVKGFRLTSTQAGKQKDLKAAARADYNVVYAAATAEWSEMVRSGKCSKHSDSANAVAARYQSRLPSGYKLTARSLYSAMAAGRSGQTPAQRGVKSIIPQKLVEAIADFSSLKQTVGDEQQPRQLVRVAVAAVKGTNMDGYFDHGGRAARFLLRVRELSHISVACREAVDDRRWQYLTNTHLSNWFKGYIDCLITHKFLPESARGMDIHNMSLEIALDILRRMFNGDESHQKLSNEGEGRGPRSYVYINKLLARAGKRTMTHQKHATILAWMNYAGEVGAPHLMLATDAQAAKRARPMVGRSRTYA